MGRGNTTLLGRTERGQVLAPAVQAHFRAEGWGSKATAGRAGKEWAGVCSALVVLQSTIASLAPRPPTTPPR